MKHLDDLDVLGEKILRSMVNIIDYRPQTKLLEGNVYTGVCLFTGGGGFQVTLTHDALDLITYPFPRRGTWVSNPLLPATYI